MNVHPAPKNLNYPAILYPGNKSHKAAWYAGYKKGFNLERLKCPYREMNGGFRMAWISGYVVGRGDANHMIEAAKKPTPIGLVYDPVVDSLENFVSRLFRESKSESRSPESRGVQSPDDSRAHQVPHSAGIARS
jgi:ribosome modulation factor